MIPTTEDLLLWGATGQARVLHELIQGTLWRLCAVVDNRPVEPPVPGVALLHGIDGLSAWLRCRTTEMPLAGAVAVGGGRGSDRLHLMDLMKSMAIQMVTLVHRTAFVAGDSSRGEGCQILARSSVCTNARLGRGVIVNTAASIDHDCELDDGVHVGPGATLAGEVRVGKRVFVGAGAIVLPRIVIGDDAVIGAGSVVTRDVPLGSVVFGNPARRREEL